MARSSDTVTFNAERYRKTVDEMRARREEVHAMGRRIYAETGKLDRLVDILGSRRLSHNSFERQDDKFVLTNGIALPVVSASDGTGSMAENLKRTFAAMGVLDTLLAPIRTGLGYNTQVSTGVAQDVCDHHPVAQMAQFESDERIAEQIRLLVPDACGGDETEDYQFILGYGAWGTDLDIRNFYGLKGYFFLMADQICREDVKAADFEHHTGLTLPGGQSMTTKAICRELLNPFHTFYLQVGSGGVGGRRNEITTWWEKRLGNDRVVIVPDPDYLAEVQTALIYVTESEQPTKEDIVRLLVEGTKSNKALDRRQAEKVWGWITDAGVPFGAQAKLRAALGCPLPKPGDAFVHFRHAWPIGHPKAGENVTPSEDGTVPALPAPKGRKPIDWSAF